ncbi:endo-1,4-beta-xylanase, partial [Enterococcus faecium]|uniref:endo-1,4-beta-xylanase n=1 Tax=Enterococcus faecium TaxID=1352 RepID=UPI003F5207DF
MVHMHNLVWGAYNPGWVRRALAEGRGMQVLARHIATVAGRYQGRALAWDVVNEPVAPQYPSTADGLCNTEWRRALG